MKLYQFIILIIVLLMLAGVATYVIFTSDMFESNEPIVNSNTANEIVLQ